MMVQKPRMGPESQVAGNEKLIQTFNYFIKQKLDRSITELQLCVPFYRSTEASHHSHDSGVHLQMLPALSVHMILLNCRAVVCV